MVSPEKLVEIKSKRIRLPEIEGFKGKLYDFQKTGVAYLYIAERANLFDICGSGKTIQVLALLQLLKNRDELSKALILTPANVVEQYGQEAKKFTSLDISLGLGEKPHRVAIYSSLYDVLILSYQIFLRDFEYLKEIGFDVVIFDEAAFFRRASTKTAKAVLKFVRREQIKRIINATATPVQNTLTDIHTLFQAIRRESVLGNQAYFRKKFLRELELTGTSKSGKTFRFTKVIGYRNFPDLKRRIFPYYIRRTLKDIESELPDLTVVTKWVDLHKEQRNIYDGDREELRKQSSTMSITDLRNSVHKLQMMIDTLASIGGEDISAKLDYLMELLQGDISGQKVVVFAHYLSTIAAIDKRLTAAKIKHVVITGKQSHEEKVARQKQFWDDSKTLVCLGTTAIEMGLNLQNSAYLVALNQFYNPTRTEQLIGRLRRIGSSHAKVVFINILASATIEGKMVTILEKKAALPNAMFDETGDIFRTLSRKELIDLLGG